MITLIDNSPGDYAKKRKLALIITAILVSMLLSALTRADSNAPKTLGWDDLIPAAPAEMMAKTVALRDRFRALSSSDLDLYQRVEIAVELERDIAAGTRKIDELEAGEQAILEENLSDSHPDIVRFWKDVEVARAAAKVQNETVREELNGSQVRIPGYMLPLDLEGQRVREFLLVPYVGACIHTPPPPINQIVFVKSVEGVTSTGMFEPVWVSGRLSTQRDSHELFMADGRGDVSTGYALDAKTVEPYKN